MEWNKLWYYVPGVGLGVHYLKERRERKGTCPWYNIREAKDRRALGMYAVETGLLAFAIAWKVYVGNGIVTGEWNPIKSIESMGENRKERKYERKEKRLEKTVNYENLLNEEH